ncbi:MAG: DUF3857 domain-containing protein [Ignavibacteriales bacterium]|nr:DUF3857 domain-containing protein [Ignavibacteriales bacterium]
MKRNLILLSFLFLGLLILCSCGGGSLSQLDDVKELLQLKEFPTQEEYPDDEALVLKESHKMQMNINSNWELETYETIYIAKKLFRNIENHTEVEIELLEGEHIEELSARTIRVDGSIIDIDSKDFYYAKGQTEGSTFYTDRESVKFTFPGAEKNCIIEYTYRIRKEFPFVMDSWYIQGYDPILYNEYKLILPVIVLDPINGAGWQWRYKVYNYKLNQPEQLENINPGDMRSTQSVTFKWAVKNIKPFRPEKLMPHFSEYISYVKFAPSEWESWNNISEWYYKYYFKPQLKITPKIKQKAEDLTIGCPDEKSKIEKLFSFVQNLRYISIALGDGNIRPNEPEQVLFNEYGDCKDKSTLLISLLQSLNIKAKPVLVRTANYGDIDKDFPNWNFNHMIVNVEASDGKKLWLDPTVQYCPINEIPWLCEDIQVLVLNDDGTSSVAKLPMSIASDNQNKMNVLVEIKSEDEVIFNVSMILSGEQNLYFKNQLVDVTNEEFKKFVKSLVVDDFLNAEILDYSFSSLDSINSNLKINYKFKVSNAFQKQADLYFLNINPYKIFTIDMSFLIEQKRNYDIQFPYLFRLERNIDVIYPTDIFSVRNLPEDVTISEKPFTYFKTLIGKEGSIKLNENFTLKSRKVTPKEYKDFLNSFEKINSKQQEKIIFTKI